MLDSEAAQPRHSDDALISRRNLRANFGHGQPDDPGRDPVVDLAQGPGIFSLYLFNDFDRIHLNTSL